MKTLGNDKAITAYPDRRIVFHFSDNIEHTVTWRKPSRSDSWTDEMREKARIAERKRHE